MGTEDEGSESNRDRKVEGRRKKRRYVQGTRAFTHAMTNSIAKRAGTTKKTTDEKESSV